MTIGETENTNTQNHPCLARPSRATPSAGRRVRSASALVPVLLAGLLGPANVAAEQGATNQSANPIRLAQASETREFSIRAQPLATALDRFSEATGISFAYTTSQLDGIRSPGVSGTLAPRQALAQLLAGTGITFQFTGADTVTLAVAQEGDGPMRLGPILVGGEAASGTRAVEGFRAETSSSATNVDAPLIETPATVNVLTRDFLDTIQPRDFASTLNYIPGVQVSFTQTLGVNIRGFSTRDFRAQNGATFFIGNLRAPRRYHYDDALFERIDVLKGTSALLYGPAQPGGILRYEKKRPQFEAQRRVEASLGSADLAEGMVDATGPLNADKTLAYRLVATANTFNKTTRGDNDVDFLKDERILINPSITWLTPTGGELYLSYEYNEREDPVDFGVPVLDEGEFLFNSDPLFADGSKRDIEAHLVTAELTQPLTDNWALTLAGRYSENDLLRREQRAQQTSGDPNLWELFRFVRNQDHKMYGLKAEVDGQFSTWGVDHQLTVGFNDYSTEFVNTGQNFDVEEDVIDPRNPVFPDRPDIQPSDQLTRNEVESTQVYVQDYIQLTEALKIFGGLTWTDAEALVDGETVGSDDAVDGSIGAIYNHNSWFNPFVSYATSLNPQSGELFGGGVIPFSEGEQIEVGLKSKWLRGRLRTTVSLFEIEQTNISQGDPENPGFVILSGDQRSRGVELEAVGQVTDQLRVTAGYSFLDAEFTESTTGNEGNTPGGVPEHKVTLFGEYAFTGGLQGWRAGVGFTHVGDREANDFANFTFDLPTYERVDLTLSYENGPFDVRASVENVFDEDYIAGSGAFVGFPVEQGAPRFFTLSVGYDF